MGKGPDQGDFETPTTDAATEPADASSAAPTDAITTDAPAFDDQLPTTTGAEATVAGGAIAAVVLIAAGLTLAWRRRHRPHW